MKHIISTINNNGLLKRKVYLPIANNSLLKTNNFLFSSSKKDDKDNKVELDVHVMPP
jgi:hypothetical protein